MLMQGMFWLPAGITLRQWDVWKLLSEHNSNWEIADKLGERHGVIVYDLGQLYDKLKVPDGTGAREKLARMFPTEAVRKRVIN